MGTRQIIKRVDDWLGQKVERIANRFDEHITLDHMIGHIPGVGTQIVLTVIAVLLFFNEDQTGGWVLVGVVSVISTMRDIERSRRVREVARQIEQTSAFHARGGSRP